MPFLEPPYSWLFQFNSSPPEMVPAASSPNYYGWFSSIAGLEGQNSETPKEKVFDNHQFLMVCMPNLNDGPFFDPSYGSKFVDEDDFETIALFGFLKELNFGDFGLRAAYSTGIEFDTQTCP